MKFISKRKIGEIIAGVIMVAVVVACVLYDWDSVNSYRMYNTATLDYVRARVVSVESSDLERGTDSSRYYGTQELLVYIKEGDYEGQEISVTNYLSDTTNVLAEEGMSIIICVDTPEDASPYFTVFNYDRQTGLAAIAGLFAVAMIVVGGRKGVRAVIGLGFTMVVILNCLVQGVFHGMSVVPFCAAVLAAVTVFALVILNGIEKKTVLFAAATLAGVAIAAGFCALSQKVLCVNGYNFSEVESLSLIKSNTGLEIEHLLFAGVLISSLGAVMDVAVSIVSSLYEVKQANPALGKKEIFASGMRIGKDMIGTMSNTLILAFTGTSLVTMLLLPAFGYQTSQLLNSDYLMLEVVRGLSSTFAVVMTVPAASAISALNINAKDCNCIEEMI